MSRKRQATTFSYEDEDTYAVDEEKQFQTLLNVMGSVSNLQQLRLMEMKVHSTQFDLLYKKFYAPYFWESVPVDGNLVQRLKDIYLERNPSLRKRHEKIIIMLTTPLKKYHGRALMRCPRDMDQVVTSFVSMTDAGVFTPEECQRWADFREEKREANRFVPIKLIGDNHYGFKNTTDNVVDKDTNVWISTRCSVSFDQLSVCELLDLPINMSCDIAHDLSSGLMSFDPADQINGRMQDPFYTILWYLFSKEDPSDMCNLIRKEFRQYLTVKFHGAFDLYYDRLIESLEAENNPHVERIKEMKKFIAP